MVTVCFNEKAKINLKISENHPDVLRKSLYLNSKKNFTGAIQDPSLTVVFTAAPSSAALTYIPGGEVSRRGCGRRS